MVGWRFICECEYIFAVCLQISCCCCIAFSVRVSIFIWGSSFWMWQPVAANTQLGRQGNHIKCHREKESDTHKYWWRAFFTLLFRNVLPEFVTPTHTIEWHADEKIYGRQCAWRESVCWATHHQGYCEIFSIYTSASGLCCTHYALDFFNREKNESRNWCSTFISRPNGGFF